MTTLINLTKLLESAYTNVRLGTRQEMLILINKQVSLINNASNETLELINQLNLVSYHIEQLNKIKLAEINSIKDEF